MTGGRYFSLFALLCLSLLLAGCTRPPETFRVGTNIWPGYEPLYLARSLGHYDNTGIQLVEMNNSTETMNALRAGVLEVAALTLDEALTVKQDGFDLKVVLVMDSSNGGDVLLARPEIKTLADLRGKRIGVESSAVGAILLQAALEAGNMKAEDIQVVQLPVNQHAHAFLDGEVDAVVTFDPVRTQLQATGAHLLFDSSRIPGRIIDVLVTTSAVAEHNGDNLKRLIAGHFAALRHLRQQPVDAARIMAPRTGLDSETFLRSFEGIFLPDLVANQKLLDGKNSPLNDTLHQLVKIMLDNRMLRREVEVGGMLDNRWLPEGP